MTASVFGITDAAVENKRRLSATVVFRDHRAETELKRSR